MKTLKLSQEEIDLLIDIIEAAETKLENQINEIEHTFKSVKGTTNKLVETLSTLKEVRQRMLFC